MISCGKQRYQDESLEQSNGVYYWRTDLHLDSTERAFLKQHHINKVYCRYFDVVMSDDGTEPKPNATIAFTDTLPAGIELIPTVYITEDCMHKPHKDLAEKLVKRIMQMNETSHQITTINYPLSTVNHHPTAPAINARATCGLWCADGLQHGRST